MTRLVLLLLGLSGLNAATAAGSPCPLNLVQTCGVDQWFDLPVHSLAGCYPEFGSFGDGGFDAVAGTLHAHGQGSLDRTGEAAAAIFDDFTVEGPYPGAPLAITARLELSVFVLETPGGCCSSGGGFGSLLSAAAGDSVGLSDSGQRTLSTPIGATVGIPFRLRILVRGYGAYDASGVALGTLAFDGLPPGHVVTSCRGFSSQPVATRSATWGDLKIRYR